MTPATFNLLFFHHFYVYGAIGAWSFAYPSDVVWMTLPAKQGRLRRDLTQSGVKSSCLRGLLISAALLLSPTVLGAPVELNPADSDPSVVLSADRLSVAFTVPGNHRAVRSTIAVAPGSGFYYYEGRRLVAPGNFGFGVATAAQTLTNFGGSSNQSIGVNALGYIFHANSSQIPGNDPTIQANDTIGIALDYRGTNPIAHVIVGGAHFHSQTLGAVTDPVFILVYGNDVFAGEQQSINAGEHGLAFAYDAASILAAAGVNGANEVVPGWQLIPETGVTIDGGDIAAVVGTVVNLNAGAENAAGDDISPSISWTDTLGGIGSGAAHSVNSATPVSVIVTATVLDESLDPVTDSVVVTFGLDPLGDEDGDGLPNAWESANGLDPHVADAIADPDLDTFDNFSEYLAGTNPQDAASFPGHVPPTLLNPADAGAGISVSADGLSATFTNGGSHRGVRSEAAVTPGSGIHYYEGTRLVGAGNFGFGVATSAETLLNYGGYSTASIGVNALGYVFYGGTAVVSGNSAISGSSTVGLAVDYRGSNPDVYVIAGGAVIYSRTMDDVTDPLYILAYGQATTAAEQQRINAGDNPGTEPFLNDVATILAGEGVDTAALNTGWHAPQPETGILVSGATTADVGTALTLTAAATSAGGINLTASVTWLDIGTGATGTGATFAVVDNVAGSHVVTATVTDEFGLPVVATTTINFVEPDADGDGLSDAEEALAGTNPALADTDADGLNDGDEVNTHDTNPLDADTDGDTLDDGLELQFGLDPSDAGDALADADADGFSNITEVLGGTDLNNSASWPGAPAAAQLNPLDAHASISISADGLGASFTLGSHHGVRSDVAVTPGSGFYYFEGTRQVGVGNFGFGVATASETLEDFGGISTQSLGVNALGYIFYGNNSLLGGSANAAIAAAQTYGIAVDYRAASPVVHVIAGGAHIWSQPVAVTDPLHILVYGNATTAGIQQVVNTAANFAVQPFVYDAESILTTAGVAGADSILDGWTAPAPQTAVSITPIGPVTQVGEVLTLAATATNASGTDISSTITWTDSASAQVGTGATFDFTASTIGFHLIEARVLNEQSEPVIDTLAITVTAVDEDGDGLSADQEAILGTSDNNPDSDGDGLSDGDEVNTHGTDPLAADSDTDTVGDGVEVAIGSDPLIADGSLDSDGDGFDNASEVAAGSDPGNPYSYPGGPVATTLNPADAWASVTLSNAGLSATFSEAAARSVRSTIAISPGSGWYYVEGMREVSAGDFGIGVGDLSAPLDAAAGDDFSSLGVTTAGEVRYGGVVVDTIATLAASTHYGLAVDYSGANPDVYVVFTATDGYRAVLAPVTLTGISGDLYIMAFGSVGTGAAQITLNAGDNPDATPFAYPAHYEIFTAGYTGAEFLGSGWGSHHTWNGIETTQNVAEVRLELDAHSGPGITLSADGLAAAYDIDQKMGVRANQGMIGEFRYWEGIRLLDTLVKLGTGEGLGIGYGLIPEYGRINPYPFTPEQPSMSLNSWNGIWRNLNYVAAFDTSVYYHGFAVDYRSTRPIVHVIIDDEVVHTMTLPDVFTPLHPLLYGNTQGIGVFANDANFGAAPFYYDPKGALERAGIDSSEFVSGWGDVNRDSDADNLRDVDEVIHGTHPLNADSDGDGLRDGDEVHELGSSPVSDDSDGDGMPDGYEFLLGQLLLVDDRFGDVDANGTDNITEYTNGTGMANEAPVVSILEVDQTVEVGTSVTFSVGVADIIDGNLAAAASWSSSDGASGSGGTYTLTLPAGVWTVTAAATDSGGLTTSADVTLTVFDPSVIDTDGDGLADVTEAALGTNPNLADTDGDSLDDGAEVNLHGTNPLATDTDGDAMPDNFEVGNGLDPTDAADALLDPDADLRNNLLEYLLGTDPQVANPPPASEIIIDNTDPGASTVEGTFTSYVAAEQYGTSATFTEAGGVVDTFRFNPTIEQAGIWRVFAWNSCYSNRATDVRHIVRHGDGTTVIEVDQDCDTGSHGEWFELGDFRFELGTDGYLDISDSGIVPPSTTYLGADAARFLLIDTNATPELIASAAHLDVLTGTAVNLTATASDPEDGDLTGTIAWSDDAGGSGSGAGYSLTPTVEGTITVLASVTDSGGRTVTATITIAAVGDDNDGLSPAEEATHGTNPADPDSDDDGLSDGDEVLIHGTNPLSADSDADGLPDGYEVTHGLNPLDAADAALDSDGDGATNLAEFLAGTDPNVAPPVDITIDDGGAGTTLVGTWGPYPGNESFGGTSRWSTVGGPVESYRFTPDLPVGGLYEVYAWNACYGNRATNVPHNVTHAAGTSSIAVDQDCDTGSHGEWFLLGQFVFDAGTGGSLEITDLGLTPAATTYFGADAARFVLISSNAIPTVTPGAPLEAAVLVGSTVNLAATAADAEDGDLTASISWTDSAGGTGSGATYAVVPASEGSVLVTAAVVDADGATGSAQFTISAVIDDYDGLNEAEEATHGTNPAIADTDADGVSDGDEVNVTATNPLDPDSDGDGMPDGFEVQNGLDPLDAADAGLDGDGDGETNLAEYLAGTDPWVAPAPAPAEVIVDNPDAGTSQVGSWSTYPGNESYNGASVWATVGGVVDRFRFTPNLPVSARFEVFAWNACYSNRATNVPHEILHADGSTTVAVDQDCDTGSHGEWFSLGVYTFNAGTGHYVEISDAGLTPPAATYMGADAVRFVQDLSNAAPVLTPNVQTLTLVAGAASGLTAVASDAEDGDLTAFINWSINTGAATATGASFDPYPAVGTHTVTASVSDTGGLNTSVDITLTVVASAGQLDDDNDGLDNDGEAAAGSDPADPDSDSDSLNDGDEVLVHGTNPTLADTDADGMGDAFEVQYALDPLNPADAALDPDGDGLTNLEEHDGGTDPTVAPVIETIIDTDGIGVTSVGSWNNFPGNESFGGDSRWATAGGGVDRFRFTPDLSTAGDHAVYAWNSCYSNRAPNVPHEIVHAGGTDVVAVDQDCDTGSHGEWFYLGTYTFDAGTSGYVEISDAGLTPAATTYIGADAVRFVRQ